MAFNGILYRQAGGTLELNRSVGSFCVVESAKLEDKWQDGGVATLVLQTTEVLTFYSGDYIIAKGKRYLICKTISEYTTLDDGKHQYTIPVESPDALFKNALMYNTVEIEHGGVYSWSRPNNFIMELGSVETLVKACCYNVNEVMGRRVFKLGTIDASVSDEYRVINFSDNNCWAGLKQTCEHFDTFYTIRANTDETPDSDYIVDIGVEPGMFPETLQVGMRQGIAELTMNYADEDVYTQFVVLGSSENLPRGYEHERLQLDEDLMGTPPVYAGSLIVDESKYARWGRKRMELIFDDIKPTRTGTITSIPEDNIFAFYDTSLSEVLAVEENWNPVGGTVHILDGNLLGYTFEIIAFHSGTYKITIKQISDSNGLLLPNADNETFRFSAGMKYNLAGIALPNYYVVDAKTRLKAAAVNAINGYWTQPRASFSITPDPFFLREKETDISCGWLIPIKHDALEIDKSIRVTSVTYDLLKDTYFDIDSVEVADITGKDNFMNSVHKSTQRSLNMLMDQGIINSQTAKENNLTAILNRIALSLHLPSWDTILEMLGDGKGLFTLINEEGNDIHVVNTDLLRAGTALVNSLFTNELFVSGVQSETESLVNNYILHLTSQVATVACDSEGTVTGELPGSTAIVYHGASADTGWSFSGEFSGCTGSVNSSTGIITITGLTADNSTVTVSATKTDKPTLQAIFRISKVYAGMDGIDGEDGVTTYTWIKYADVADGTGLYDTPTANTLYIGIAVNKTTPTESTTKTDYTWSKFKGDQGVAGEDGATTYTWIKYGTSSAGAGITDDPTGMTYIGLAYNKTTPTESTTPGDYTWSLIKGTDGIDGIDGEDAVYYYLTPSVDAVIRSMDGTATPSTVSCAQYKIQGGGTPVAANKTIKYQRSIDGTMQTYSTAVAVSTSIYIDFYLYDGVTELWRTRVPVLHDLDEWESTLNDFAKGLGYTDTVGGASAYEKLVGAALAGETIMEGGYLRNSLIDTEHLIADDAFINRIATNSITIGKITDTAAALDDAMQIGGRNLFSKVHTRRGDWYDNNGTTVRTDGNSFAIAIKVYKGGDYTINFNNSIPLRRVWFIKDETILGAQSFEWVNGVNLPHIINVSEDATYIMVQGSKSLSDELIDSLKVEKGNKATDWTPAPEDVQEDYATKFGYSSYSDLVAQAAEGLTIIDGGHIRTSLIEANEVVANAAFIGGLTIGENKLYLGTGTYGNANTPFYVEGTEAYKRFSLGNKFSFDGTDLTINGGGTFTGQISVGGVLIGKDAFGSGLHGIKLNDYNYWYLDGANAKVKFGGETNYISWDGTTLKQNGAAIGGGSIVGTSIDIPNATTPSFKVTGDGIITAKSGTIGALKISATQAFLGTGAYNNANTPFYVDTSNRFSLGSKLTFSSAGELTINGGGTFSGALSAATGSFAGLVNAGGIKVGAGAISTNVGGLYIDTNNYWDELGNFKAGGSSSYLYWNGTTFSVKGDITGSTGTFSGVFAGSVGAGDAIFGVAAGGAGNDGLYINANNYWYDTGVFKVGSSTKYLYFDGTNATFTGALSAASGTFAGTVAIGETLKIGASVNGTNNGLFINSNNYWYGSGALKIGGAGAYLLYESGALSMVGGSISAGSFTTTDGTTSVDISPTAVSGAGVRVSKGDAFAQIGLSGSWPSVHIRQGGTGTPSALLTPGQVTVGDTVYATLQKNQLSLSGLVFNTTNLGTGNVVKTSGGGFLRFGATVDNEDGSHKHSKVAGYTVSVVASMPGTPDANTIYFVTGS